MKEEEEKKDEQAVEMKESKVERPPRCGKLFKLCRHRGFGNVCNLGKDCESQVKMQ